MCIKDNYILMVECINAALKSPEIHLHFHYNITKYYIFQKRDREIAMAYGFYCYHSITSFIRGGDLEKTNLLKVVNLYDSLLEEKNEDWFIHLMKVLLYEKFLHSKVFLYDMLQEVKDMIEIQKIIKWKEPCFIISYIFMAIYYYHTQNYESVVKMLDLGIEGVPHGHLKMGAMSLHLIMPIRRLYNQADYNNKKDIVDKMKVLCMIYFPEIIFL